MIIVVRSRPDRIAEVERYLYQGQQIIGEPVESRFGTFLCVQSAHGLAGKMLADRLASGMFGATTYETLEEAMAYIESEL